MRMHNPAHPGEVLASFIEGRKISDVATHLGITRVALSRVLHGHAAVSAEMAIRLGKAFNTEPEFWMRMQIARDIWVAGQKKLNIKPLPPLRAA
jgi:addiction module HigA family antidote